ncbi:PREDICTED: E3 ubiquitin-protein ligase BRE1B-like [Calidris pugnax]|uniref:E3 ubiquitin-protein ligase BRE1B-like n=1 Tax=Calidris pugnax TaxID=198806 RepID=UPI00071E66BA|nr:PREDICTED: E3 ubiquitin-protein ligase BRE1B-like [Calidris pugnax]
MSGSPGELSEPGRALLRELLREHRRLQDLTLQLQEKHHRVSLELAELQDKATSAETKVLEMETTVEGLQWDSAKLRKREGRLDRHLAEALEQVALRSLPEEAVKETLEYKVLQSQFSLLYHESLQVKTQLDEARALLLATKNSHLRHIEHMESDELGVQKRLRTEVIQLEDTLAQVRKEYEMLRIEFEQNLAANEQAGEDTSPPPGHVPNTATPMATPHGQPETGLGWSSKSSMVGLGWSSKSSVVGLGWSSKSSVVGLGWSS